MQLKRHVARQFAWRNDYYDHFSALWQVMIIIISFGRSCWPNPKSDSPNLVPRAFYFLIEGSGYEIGILPEPLISSSMRSKKIEGSGYESFTWYRYRMWSNLIPVRTFRTGTRTGVNSMLSRCQCVENCVRILIIAADEGGSNTNPALWLDCWMPVCRSGWSVMWQLMAN